MDVKAYIFSIIATSVIAGVLLSIIKEKSSYGYLIKILAGLFVAVTVVAPLVDFRLSDLVSQFEDFDQNNNLSIQSGITAYNNALAESIIERTEAYILEKASSYGAAITAKVIVNSETQPIPTAVELSGDISPYNKLRITQILVNDLGIPEEAQTWK